MHISRTLAVIGLALGSLFAGEAEASMPGGPSRQQMQCTADGGSFSAGYGADTYVCVSLEGGVQTCDFGERTPKCTSEDGVIRNRAAKHDQIEQSSPSVVRAMPTAPVL